MPWFRVRVVDNSTYDYVVEADSAEQAREDVEFDEPDEGEVISSEWYVDEVEPL